MENTDMATENVWPNTITAEDMADLFEVPMPVGAWEQDMLPDDAVEPEEVVEVAPKRHVRSYGAGIAIRGAHSHQPHYIQAFTSPDDFTLV